MPRVLPNAAEMYAKTLAIPEALPFGGFKHLFLKSLQFFG
jgi:hypothetical protein